MKAIRLAIMRGMFFCVFAALFSSFPVSAAQTPAAQSEVAAGSDTETYIGTISELQANALETSEETPDSNESLDNNRAAADDVPNAFQRFIASSVGQILPIYGRSFFNTSFSPVTNVPVPDDYIVGPEDEIILRVWGQQNFQTLLRVDRSGEVFIPQVGSVSLAGLQYRQLSGYLRSQLDRIYENFDISVTMGRLRSIQIFVTGNAVRPGRYTVSALSTMVNAVAVSGGPLTHGTMRGIQLRRDGQLVAELDLYELLQSGDKTGDARLQPEDVIHIPVVGVQIAIAGSVRVPAIYELKKEKTVGEVVEMAMGFSSVANREIATIERIRGGVARETIDLLLDDSGMKAPVADGDLLQVFTISSRFEDTVTLRGNVASPRRFPWHPGMRLRDLIPNRESLISSDYWHRINQLGNIHNEESSPISIVSGVVDINWSYAVIERQDPVDLQTHFIPFNLGKLVLENDESQNLALFSGDIVMIFSEADIHVPQMQQTRTIRLEGEFNSPGLYTIAPGETLGNLIAKAGGLTPQAYLFGAEFTRLSVRRSQQARMEDYISDLESELALRTRERQESAIDSSNLALINSELASQRRIIDNLRSLRSTGRIILGLKPDSNDISTIAGLTLENGDVFMVPPRSSVINVFGAVYNPSSFIHDGNQQAESYLNLTGGITRTADRNRMYIIRADGSVLPNQNIKNFLRTKLNPGDTLVVPERMAQSTFLRELRDWAQVVGQFGLGVAAVNALRQ